MTADGVADHLAQAIQIVCLREDGRAERARRVAALGRFDDMIEVLSDYLQRADDEGNAYGMLAAAYLKLGNRDAARRAYERGAEVAQAHGHPSMAQDYRLTVETEFDED